MEGIYTGARDWGERESMKAMLGNAQPWRKEASESRSWGAEKSAETLRKDARDKETNSVFLVRRMPQILPTEIQMQAAQSLKLLCSQALLETALMSPASEQPNNHTLPCLNVTFRAAFFSSPQLSYLHSKGKLYLKRIKYFI